MLTLFIENITWLDKNDNSIRVDLVNKNIDTFSEYYELYDAEKYSGGWKIEFLMTSIIPNHTFNGFSHTYYDDNENEYFINRTSTTTSLYDDNQDDILKENQFIETLYLTDYTDDIVYLKPSFSSIYTPENPIEIKIK